MAHEIKNPLNAIGINLQMIQSKLAENNKEELSVYINHKINSALNESKRLEGLLNGFLHYSRQDETIEEVNIEIILKECVELLRVEADAKKLMLSVSGSCNEKVKCGKGKIKQVFINLILNAIQNTESGYVELLIDYPNYERPNAIGVKVIDTGSGIKKEDQNKIFNMFYTTRKHGTGLGLHVARALLDEIHGKIYLEKSEHTGSVFVVELPIAKTNYIGYTIVVTNSHRDTETVLIINKKFSF
jgi:signal transduction histidine kinase